jgi:hypothetical protein
MAQENEYWQPVGREYIAWQPGRLQYSENLNLILYTGPFDISADQQHEFRHFAGYNGSEWEVWADTVGGGVRTVVDYENGILVGGSTPYIGTQNMPYIAYFDGEEWSYPWVFDGTILKLVWVNGNLFALGGFTEINGEPISYIAKLVDGNWEGVIENPEIIDFALFGDMVYYDGQYYISGNFSINEGPSDLAILQDGEFLPLGESLTGNWTMISDLEVFQGELFVGGLIAASQGNVGNHLVRWDGETFSDVGGATFLDNNGDSTIYNGIGELQVHDGYLYAGGSFRYFGENAAYEITNIARWDGSQWCGFYANNFENYCLTYEVIDDKILMMAWPNEGDTAIGSLHQFWEYNDLSATDVCTQPLSTNKAKWEESSLLLYPNPSIGLITLESEKPIQSLVVFDALGKLVYQENTQYQSQLQIDLGHLTKGLYLVQVEGDGSVGSRKVVLE